MSSVAIESNEHLSFLPAGSYRLYHLGLCFTPKTLILRLYYQEFQTQYIMYY